MGYQEKKSIMGIITTLVTNIIYISYIYTNYFAKDAALLSDIQFWGKVLIMLIPIAIVSRILAEILFIIVLRIATGDEEPDFEDERDKMIRHTSGRAAHIVTSIGIAVGFGLLALGQPIHVFFIVLWCMGILSEITEFVMTLIGYVRGY